MVSLRARQPTSTLHQARRPNDRRISTMNRMLSFAAALAALSASIAWAQEHGPVEVSTALKHDSLPSLRNTVPQPDGYKRWHERDEHMVPLPYFPPNQVDGALQDSARRSPTAPTFQSGVDGVGTGFTGPNGTFSVDSAPPDTVGAVGDTQYVQVVNTGLAVFDKATKNVVYGPVPTNTLWSGFGGQCENDNDGDAVVVYDKAANRWIVSQFAVGTTPYLQCVAVSHTSDATGAWYRYAFSYGSVFPDYPKMGVWPDAYYETFNMFNGNSFNGSLLCAYDRASMLTGAAATQQCFQLAKTFGGVLPSDLDGSTAPPTGAPNYMVNFGTNSLNLWKFHVDWANTANTSLTGPANLAVAAFTPACGGGACVIQPGTHEQLDTLADRVMHRLAYRNFGDHESLVVNHAVKVGTLMKNPYSGVRWYEIRSPGAAPAIYQQSTFSPDSSFRWMGSIAMDADGNIALGYSVSSATVDPGIAYTGRLSGDALNTMQAETTIVAGSGAQTTGLDRWGDYSAMTIDPVDDCTFWYTNEYLKTDGTFNWSTRIGSLKFAGCNATKQGQTIGFNSNAPAGAVYNGPMYVVAATATSGLAVTFTIAAASATVCSISGSTVSFIGVGTCTINANQSGSVDYNAAPQVQQSFGVGKAAQAISFDSTAPGAAAAGGPTYQVLVSATSGLAVSVAIDAGSTAVCQLSGGTTGSSVSFIGAGMCKINATQAGDANHSAAAPAQQSFAVAPGPPASLAFTTQPTAIVTAGAVLGTIAVTEKDAFGDLIDDNASVVDFTIALCGGFDLGSATMSHGVATLSSNQRFYTTSSYQISAKTGVLTGTSALFSVQDGSNNLLFADSFDGCHP
jgi:hypothetical protein